MITLSAESNASQVIYQVQKIGPAVDAAIKRALNQAGEFTKSSIQKGFEASKDPDGKPWAPLDPKVYPYRPNRKGIITPPDLAVKEGDKPLINHGVLMGSVTYVFYSNSEVRVGYGIPGENGTAAIARRHQLGIGSMARIFQNGRETRKWITPKIRVNIGFAKWPRHGAMNDFDSIAKIFQTELEKVDVK